jgi:hypothetical protein
MKHRIVAILLLSAGLWAQSGPASGASGASSPVSGLGYSQFYCSGFITRDAIPRSSFVLGSKESPHEDHFAGRSLLFLRGTDLTPGTRYSVVRQIADPNREDSSPEQRSRLASLGDLYEDVGWVTVQSVENATAIATFDFSCGTAIPGDIVVPFQERPQLTLRRPEAALETFRSGSAAVRGRILGSRDFVGLLGNGQTVYTDFGSAKGAKPGDYLIISRGYAPDDLNKVDRASEGLPRGAEGTAVNAATLPRDDSRMPTHILGELLVLNVSPDASTALITRASAEVELGDAVQMEGAQAEDAASQPAAGANVAGAGAERASCQSASRLRRLLFLSHGCKAARE